ncbi:hypothetical protein DFJ74DRAFT_58391 [Hyaloraphidium curvatum]|nr:hypothetical protein DFJ74DRAFT_58391 [Hyaloraphidium curvatum]
MDAPRDFRIVGFTGHRNLHDPESARTSIATAIAQFRRGSPSLDRAVSSAAAGADLAFARAALGLGMRWKAVLPLPEDEFARDFSAAEWEEVRTLLSRAVLTTVPSLDRDRTREDAYLAAGHAVVDDCDVLLAFWDRLPARGQGGTADVVAYARRTGRPVVIIDPETGTTADELRSIFPVSHRFIVE